MRVFIARLSGLSRERVWRTQKKTKTGFLLLGEGEMVSWDTPARVLLPHRLAAFTQTAVAHYKGHLHHHHEIRFDLILFPSPSTQWNISLFFSSFLLYLFFTIYNFLRIYYNNFYLFGDL